MKHYFLFLVFLIGSSSLAQKTPGDFWGNVRFGGGVGLGFTNENFNASVSPSAIFQVNDQFAAGASLNFNYAKFNEDKLFAYGGSILSLYNPIPNIQLSGELEQLRINRTYALDGGNREDNYWSPALFLGIGYSNRNLTLGLRYDILYDDGKSIYANALMPFVRVYF
ncbi:MAG: alpha-ketoglutarate decarboxylase [Maribacter sp.]|nr:MAG: alpha-ketoglutarate decarboxylase [Maribacter sp.]